MLTRWPPLQAVLFVVLVVALAAVPAHAGDRVIGWGYAFDLPDRFTPRADDPPPRSRILDEVLIWSLPLRVMGEPRRAGYGLGPVDAPEATLRACRFLLAEDRAPESVLDIAADAVRQSYEEVVDTLTMSNLIDCAFKQTRGGLPVVLAKITYKHHASGPRFVQSALFLKDTTGLVITLEAPYDMQFEYEAYFLKMIDTVNLMDPAPTLMEQVRIPGMILIGALVLYLAFLVTRRRVREKRRRRPVPRMQVIDSTPTTLTRASLDESSVDELTALGAPVPGEPEACPDLQARTDPEAAPEAGAPLPPPKPDRAPAARPGLEPSRAPAAEPAPSSEDAAEPSAGTPKITRNADFLR